MEASKSIADRIELIVLTFQVGRKFAEEINDQVDLASQLNEVDVEFRSMAFEGASLAIAIKSIEAEDGLMRWFEFLDSNPKYATQIMIGLGWAIGEKDLQPNTVLNNLDSMIQARALDGYGYFMGLFRRRVSIRTQQIPEGIPEGEQMAFDQGIGRSLWYISKGDIEMLERMMNAFPEYRQKHMWQGIGVACSVVGGFDADLLQGLMNLAGEFNVQLKTGCVLAARSSVAANSENQFLNVACKLWLNRSVLDSAQLTEIENTSYANWIDGISLMIKS